MKKNTKALSTAVIVGIVLAIIIIAAIIVGISMSTPATPETSNPIDVYIDTVLQEGNYTTARTIDWGNISPGNTYTKNFTVASNSDQPLLLKLYTTEPEGCTQSWAKNNTMLQSAGVAESTLVLTLGDMASSGKFTWKLLAVNGTMPTPTPVATPTPQPTPTPEPETLECTVQAEPGCLNVTVTNDAGQEITKQASDLPFTFLFTQGDTLEFSNNAKEGFEFNAYVLSDTTWYDTPDLILTNRQANFTITVEFDDITG